MESRNNVQRARDKSIQCPEENSKFGVLFMAVIAQKVRKNICAVIGADANLMNSALLRRLQNSVLAASVTNLPTPRKFESAAHMPDGTCRYLLQTG